MFYQAEVALSAIPYYCIRMAWKNNASNTITYCKFLKTHLYSQKCRYIVDPEYVSNVYCYFYNSLPLSHTRILLNPLMIKNEITNFDSVFKSIQLHYPISTGGLHFRRIIHNQFCDYIGFPDQKIDITGSRERSPVKIILNYRVRNSIGKFILEKDIDIKCDGIVIKDSLIEAGGTLFSTKIDISNDENPKKVKELLKLRAAHRTIIDTLVKSGQI